MRRTNMYVVYWAPDESDAPGVIKVGVEKSDQRRKEWARRGATICALFIDVPTSWEARALAALASRYPRAFDNESESKWLLGRGYGFSECFLIDHDRRAEAMQVVAAAIGAAE